MSWRLFLWFSWILYVRTELLFKTCKQAVFEKKEGSFYSVGFPKAIEAPQCFVYHFEAPQRKHVEIEFETAEVPSPIGSGCLDFIRIYDAPKSNTFDETSKDYEEFCGKNSLGSRPVFVSAANNLFLVIHAEVSRSVRIKGSYRFLDSLHYLSDAQRLAPGICEFRANSLQGTIWSPKAPYYTPDNSNCSYSFPSLQGHLLKINVTKLSLSKSDCHDNYLAVYQLRPRSLIEKLCSSIEIPFVFSTKNGLLLEFKTGPRKGQRRFRSFSLDYEYVFPEASNVSRTDLSGIGPAMWAVILGNSVPNADSRCPVRIVSSRAIFPNSENNNPSWTNNSGILSSEHFAPSENTNFKCQFVFVGAPDEHVHVVFRKFKLFAWKDKGLNSSSEMRCEEMDHVSSHVLVGSRMSKIFDFCGSEIPPPLMSAKNILTLDYVVKSMGGIRPTNPDEDYGFIIEYNFLTDWGNQPKEAIRDPTKSCTFSFNSTIKKNGHLWSPNHPGFYPRNLDCEYVFHGIDGQIVVIHFEYFDIEGFGQCEAATHSDFVLFSNYKTTDKTNRRYCGPVRPPGAMASESNYFRMVFRTNDIFDGTGFYGHYQFVDQQSRQSNHVKLATSSGRTPQFKNFLFLLFLVLRIMESSK